MSEIVPGLDFTPFYLDRPAQAALMADIAGVLAEAPLFTPSMPRTGKRLSVAMSNCGPLGWVTDKELGYRYQETHPETGRPWPSMPEAVTRAWRDLTGRSDTPQACLINFYAPNARMGLHQDRDEEDLTAPVVSLSLGDTALFRIGGTERRAPTRSFKLQSGDALVLGGTARLAFHGVDRIVPGTSTLLAEAGLPQGRINLTLRRVTPD